MVQQGRVSVNGRVVTELPILIDPESDKVAIDDETVKLKGKSNERRVYLVMNKPKGVYSTNVAQGEQTRAIDLLPPGFPARVYPVGRLDAESKGLLLLTNDGDLTNQLTHPRYGIPKTYRAMVDGFVKNELVDEMAKGVWLADPKTGKGFKTGRTQVRIVKRSRDKSQLELTLREGRNRQVRRMLARLGHKVRDLTRIKMGPLTLQGLGPGEFRPLTPREVRELREMAQSRVKRQEERKGEQRQGRQRPRDKKSPRDGK